MLKEKEVDEFINLWTRLRQWRRYHKGKLTIIQREKLDVVLENMFEISNELADALPTPPPHPEDK